MNAISRVDKLLGTFTKVSDQLGKVIDSIRDQKVLQTTLIQKAEYEITVLNRAESKASNAIRSINKLLEGGNE